PGDPISAEVSISTNPINRLTKDATGLLVPAELKRVDIIFNGSYHWLDDDKLMLLKATRAYTLPQDLEKSTVNMLALPGQSINSEIIISKVAVGSNTETELGRIFITYNAANDVGTPADPDAVPPVEAVPPHLKPTIGFSF